LRFVHSLMQQEQVSRLWCLHIIEHRFVCGS